MFTVYIMTVTAIPATVAYSESSDAQNSRIKIKSKPAHVRLSR